MFADEDYEQEYRQQRAVAEHRHARFDQLVRRANEADEAGEFLLAADLYERAQHLAGTYEREILRARVSQMRRLAKNGGDRAALVRQFPEQTGRRHA